MRRVAAMALVLVGLAGTTFTVAMIDGPAAPWAMWSRHVAAVWSILSGSAVVSWAMFKAADRG